MSSQLSKQPDTPNKRGQAKFRRSSWRQEKLWQMREEERVVRQFPWSSNGQLHKEATCLSVSRRRSWAKARSVRQDIGSLLMPVTTAPGIEQRTNLDFAFLKVSCFFGRGRRGRGGSLWLFVLGGPRLERSGQDRECLLLLCFSSRASCAAAASCLLRRPTNTTTSHHHHHHLHQHHQHHNHYCKLPPP